MWPPAQPIAMNIFGMKSIIALCGYQLIGFALASDDFGITDTELNNIIEELEIYRKLINEDIENPYQNLMASDKTLYELGKKMDDLNEQIFEYRMRLNLLEIYHPRAVMAQEEQEIEESLDMHKAKIKALKDERREIMKKVMEKSAEELGEIGDIGKLKEYARACSFFSPTPSME